MYELFTLNNGLRVVVEHIEYVNSISVGLWVKSGSRNENRDNNGISHFIEHMLFKGTKNRTAKQIASEIEEVGGQINAFTGKEATCFYIKALNTHLELALDVLSDMIFNSNFNNDDIEKEKKVIYEEIDMNEDSPEDVLMDLHSTAIWGNDSISLPILGTKEILETFDSNKLKKHVSSYYTPENSVISICGNFNKINIKSVVDKFFGRWQNSINQIVDYSNPEISNKKLFKIKNIEQLHMNIGIPGIETGNEEVYTLALLCNILGGGASSILFQKLREELSMCYSIYAYSSSLINTGIISIYAAINSKYISQVIEVINNELYNFSTIKLSQEKLYKSKEQLKANYILGLESTSSRMFKNGRNVLYLNKLVTPEEVINKIENISMRDIEKTIGNTFKKGMQNFAFVGNDFDVVSQALKYDLKLCK